ncbi:MAG: hypothetical protein R2788_21600 [Saprospiraceae bacterium]
MKNSHFRLTLRIAAIYNVLWGAWVVLFPNHFFDLLLMPCLKSNSDDLAGYGHGDRGVWVGLLVGGEFRPGQVLANCCRRF